MVEAADLEVLLPAHAVAACVDRLAKDIAADIEADAVVVCLLTGGLWFAADLTRALAARGLSLGFDALWLSSYGDEKRTTGRLTVVADLQRSVAARSVLIVDDVFDTGLSLAGAVEHVRAAGAGRVRTAVFARKPWPYPREVEPDYVAWEAPARFLVGYGMDAGGLHRGLPFIGAAD